MRSKLRAIYGSLYSRFGPQGWWPSRNNGGAFEVCVGAILTQNTSWKNVEKALDCLQAQKLLSFNALSKAKPQKIAACVRSSGYYNQKTKKLKAFTNFVARKGGLAKFLAQPTGKLRTDLLSINGIGPETADSIVLYAAKKPKFVVDAYTKRIFSRLGFINEKSSYDEFQKLFEENLERDAKMFNEFHALLVELAKRNCWKNEPDCAACPLQKKCAFGRA